MAKSLKKYKKPPRSARELVVEEQTPPAQRKAMKALGIPPKMAPVKKATRKPAPPPIMKQVTSEDESDGRVDSGNEGGVELELPVSTTQLHDVLRILNVSTSSILLTSLSLPLFQQGSAPPK